jgi:site-specific recombinase XerD
LVRELMTRYPEGPIFRTESGQPWKLNTICARFASIITAANNAAARSGGPTVREAVTAYSYRHAYVTRWLEAGENPLMLCELLDTSMDMLRRHYSHLFERTETLRDHLNSFERMDAAAVPLTPNAAAS